MSRIFDKNLCKNCAIFTLEVFFEDLLVSMKQEIQIFIISIIPRNAASNCSNQNPNTLDLLTDRLMSMFGIHLMLEM